MENYGSRKTNEKITDILKVISIKELLTYQTYGNTLQELKENYNNPSNHIREYLNKKKYHNKYYTKVFNSLEDLLKVNFDNLDGNLHFVIYGRNKDAIQCKNINEFINTIKKDIKPSSVIKIELGREKNNNDNIPNETFIRGFVSSVNLKYVKNMDIKAGFNNYVWSHGLDGHNNKNIFTNAKSIVDNPKIELCCSFQGKEVGTVGLYVKGDCRFASVNDINSFIEAKTGYRKVNPLFRKSSSTVSFFSLKAIPILPCTCICGYFSFVHSLKLSRICAAYFSTESIDLIFSKKMKNSSPP